MAELKTVDFPLPTDLLSLFAVGMWRAAPMMRPPRDIEDMDPDNPPVILNLGAGYKYIDFAENLSAETGWQAPDLYDYADDSVETVYALHFLEHLDKLLLMQMLKQIERVLKPEGQLNVVVPYYGAQLAYQDLDHKTFWTVETWDNLLNNKYYDGTMPRYWRLVEQFSIIMGLNDRNLVVVSQLIKK